MRSTTTLRGIRSARRRHGNSFALVNRQSCHASVSLILEKRGGCCRTDGPRRVLSCQMRHSIAAINAAWCPSLSALSLLSVGPTPPAAGSSSQLAASADSLTAHGRTAQQPTFTCISLMLCLCVMLKVPSRSSVRSLLVLLPCKQRCLSWGTIGPCRGVLLRTNYRCVVGQ